MSAELPSAESAIRLNAVLVPVDDMGMACSFLEKVLKLPLKFRDGDRYAAFELQGLTLALLGGDERIVMQPALGIRVDDLATALAQMELGGAVVSAPVSSGPHEFRAVIQVPGSLAAVISQKKT